MRLVVAAASLLFATACFDVDPEPDPTPKSKGSISGSIRVSGSGGFAVVDRDHRDAFLAATVPPPANVLVGERIDATGRRLPELIHEFVAGDAVVMFDKRGAFTERTLVAALEQMKQRVPASAGLGKVTFTVDRCMVGTFCRVRLSTTDGRLGEKTTQQAVEALHKVRLPGMKHVGTNDIAHGFRLPNDPFFAQQWHLPQVKLPAAWDLTIGDDDLVVAVVDSGVVHANPDLRDRLARDPANSELFVEMDFVDVADSNDGDGPDLSAEDPGDNLFGNGAHSFHGTHVAGIVGAETDNGTGVAGAMWRGQVVPVRVLGNGLAGNVFDILTGLFWAVGETDTGTGLPGTLKPARIVNMSLGGATSTAAQQQWEEALDIIFTDAEGKYNDPIIIVAAGNSAINVEQIVPANIPRLITVGASRFDGLRASYSNFGGLIDVIAPGGQSDLDLNNDNQADGILSTLNVDIGFEQGTSMSAPLVAGIAGLLVSSKPTLQHDDVHALLKATADVRFRCNEGCGEGMVDAVQAMLAAGVEAEPEPVLALDAARVVFASGTNTALINVVNFGNLEAPFTVAFERSQADLFTVSPTSGVVPPLSSLELELTLDRGAVLVGTTVLVVTGTGAATGQEVTATLSFDTNPTRDRLDLSEVEVAVFTRDAAGLTEVGSTIAIAADNFAWTVGALAPGTYEVYAVGDDNHDGTFDKQRESFGAWSSTTTIQPVEIVDENVPVKDITFSVALQATPVSTKGVGAPCTDDTTAPTECADILDFAPSVGCIVNFEGGYCSRFCQNDNICGPNARCDALSCPDVENCGVCLQSCVSDSQCRDGYLCVLDTCVPVGFDDFQ
jgi:serine protease